MERPFILLLTWVGAFRPTAMIKAFFTAFAALLLALPLPAFAQTSPASREQIYSALLGQWTGSLEYRDFQSNERVLLPTWLEVRPSADGKSVDFTYTYDDGPTKSVMEKSTITIDEAAHQFTVTSDRNKSSDVFQVSGNEQKSKRIKLTIIGSRQENHKPVDVRITIKIDRNLYQFTKETRAAGQEFAFRDGYTLTRRNP